MTVAILGEALIDFIPGADGAYRPHLGGSPYNLAIGLARQGTAVSYLSPLSQDAFGNQLREALIDEGVHTPTRRRSAWPTSLAIITLDDDGNPAYRLYREGIADKDLTLEEIQAHLPEHLEIFHTGSLAITPSQLTKIRETLKLMRARGVIVSIDINIRLGASLDTKAYLEGVRSLFPFADILKASLEDLEALDLASEQVRSAEIAHKEMDGGMFLLTEGRGGARLYTDQGVISQDAYQVSQIQDAVGAGDSFHAAFLAFISRGGISIARLLAAEPQLLGNALDYACAAAAINLSRAGCSPPTRREVEALVGR